MIRAHLSAGLENKFKAEQKFTTDVTPKREIKNYDPENRNFPFDDICLSRGNRCGIVSAESLELFENPALFETFREITNKCKSQAEGFTNSYNGIYPLACCFSKV